VDLNKITEKIIGCCIEVHKQLGPGLLESIYESALCIEFDEKNLKYERQKILPVKYKTKNIGEFRVDIVVENQIVLELKNIFYKFFYPSVPLWQIKYYLIKELEWQNIKSPGYRETA
jgi:GxxExxY protein